MPTEKNVPIKTWILEPIYKGACHSRRGVPIAIGTLSALLLVARSAPLRGAASIAGPRTARRVSGDLLEP